MGNGITFNRILGAYLAIGLLLALIIPPDYIGSELARVLTEHLPFVKLFESAPNHLGSISLFFLAMWVLMPPLLFLLARKPQKKLPIYSNKSVVKMFYVTILALIMFSMMLYLSYMQIDVSSSATRGKTLIYFASHSRFWLGLVGSAFMLAMAMTIYYVFILIPRLWLHLFSEKDN